MDDAAVPSPSIAPNPPVPTISKIITTNTSPPSSPKSPSPPVVTTITSQSKVNDSITQQIEVQQSYPILDKSEQKVGISEYLTDSSASIKGIDQGFSAVLKARFSDFVVHEGMYISCFVEGKKSLVPFYF